MSRRAAAKSRSKSIVRETNSADGERLQKVLAAAGKGSRRECEELILSGRVEVDQQVVDQLGVRVDLETQEVRLDGEVITQSRRIYYLVNKPPGVVSTARDPSGRERVIDLVPKTSGRLFNVGRLDMASEGLILVTNDGPLADRLTHPRYEVEKTYHVVVAGQPSTSVLAQLKQGVHLAEGFAKVVNVKVKTRRKQSTILEMVLDEGRNREIRRLLARVGHKVLQLKRVAVGPIRLGEMPVGTYRELTYDEIRLLRKLVDQGETQGAAPRKKRSVKRKVSRSPVGKRKTSKGPGRGAETKKGAKKGTGGRSGAGSKRTSSKSGAGVKSKTESKSGGKTGSKSRTGGKKKTTVKAKTSSRGKATGGSKANAQGAARKKAKTSGKGDSGSGGIVRRGKSAAKKSKGRTR